MHAFWNNLKLLSILLESRCLCDWADTIRPLTVFQTPPGYEFEHERSPTLLLHE
jgi:hypothetical protein